MGRRFGALWRRSWRSATTLDDPLLLAAVAIIVPFGWVLPLCRWRPARVFLRSLRPR